MKRFIALLLMGVLQTTQLWAQTVSGLWVQVEAVPTLSEGQTRAAAYAARLPDVSGFALASGWYAIALGPYSEAEARDYAERLRSARVIPADSYTTTGNSYGAQFWPIGVSLAPAAPPPAPEAPPEPEETLRQAQASENALSRAQRQSLQESLTWEGVYTGAIDGAFGPATRQAMSAWQSQNGFEATGVLTRSQRAVLLQAAQTPFALEALRDEASGIEISLPLDLVRFTGYAPPFVRFEGPQHQVLLVSQSGDAARLSGLYEFLQAQGEIPPEGARSLTANGFRLEGEDAERFALADVTLKDGAIKGFVLLAPTAEKAQMRRLAAQMRQSMIPFGGTLGSAQSLPSNAAPRLTENLRLAPQAVQAGVFVDGRGHVLTAAVPIAHCTQLLLDGAIPAQRLAEKDGAALLAPLSAIAPRAVAGFGQSPDLRASVAVAGFPFAATLSRASLTFGQMGAREGYLGQAQNFQLDLPAQAGDIGGPLLDASGAVVGLLLPPPAPQAQVLPETAQEALGVETLRALLQAQGLSPQSAPLAPLSPEALLRQAERFTVQVSCG